MDYFVNSFRLLARAQYGSSVARQSPAYFYIPVDAPLSEPEPIEDCRPARLVHYFGNRFGISLINDLTTHFDTMLDEPEHWAGLIERGWTFELCTRHEYSKDEGKYKLADIKIEASAPMTQQEEAGE